MVVVVDFDSEAEDPLADLSHRPAGFALPRLSTNNVGDKQTASHDLAQSINGPVNELDENQRERPNPNLNILSEALGCYPSAMTSSLYFDTLQ